MCTRVLLLLHACEIHVRSLFALVCPHARDADETLTVRVKQCAHACTRSCCTNIRFIVHNHFYTRVCHISVTRVSPARFWAVLVSEDACSGPVFELDLNVAYDRGGNYPCHVHAHHTHGSRPASSYGFTMSV